MGVFSGCFFANVIDFKGYIFIRNYMKLIYSLFLVLILIIFVTGCKTTNDNYTKNLSKNNYSVNVNGKTYIFIFENLSWDKAYQGAIKNGGQLATFNSLNEMWTIWEKNNSLYPNMIFWIGLTDKNREGQWKWIDGEHLGTDFIRETNNYWQGLEKGDELVNRDYAHITMRFGILSRSNSGRIPSNLFGRPYVDGYIVEIENP
jgi:hypothetical protein